MKTNIIRIGNSCGIRLPKSLLQECGLDEGLKEVDVTVKEKKLIISKAGSVRAGWELAFKKMAKAKDDQLLDKDLPDINWDKTEWTWN